MKLGGLARAVGGQTFFDVVDLPLTDPSHVSSAAFVRSPCYPMAGRAVGGEGGVVLGGKYAAAALTDLRAGGLTEPQQFMPSAMRATKGQSSCFTGCEHCMKVNTVVSHGHH